jgi:hypothetical protein
MRKRLFILLLLVAGSLTGCMTPTQQSDWNWKQYNPEYQPAHDFDREGHF